MSTFKDTVSPPPQVKSRNPASSFGRADGKRCSMNKVSSQAGSRRRLPRVSKSTSNSASPKPSPSAIFRNTRYSQIAQSRPLLTSFGHVSNRVGHNRSLTDRPMSWHVSSDHAPAVEEMAGSDVFFTPSDDMLFSAISSSGSSSTFPHQYYYDGLQTFSGLPSRHSAQFTPNLYNAGLEAGPDTFLHHQDSEFDNYINLQHLTALRQEDNSDVLTHIEKQGQHKPEPLLMTIKSEEENDEFGIEEDLVGLGLYDDDNDDEKSSNGATDDALLFGTLHTPRKALRLEQEWRPPQVKGEAESLHDQPEDLDVGLKTEFFVQSYDNPNVFDYTPTAYGMDYGVQFPYMNMDALDQKGPWSAGAEPMYCQDYIVGFNVPYAFAENAAFV